MRPLFLVLGILSFATAIVGIFLPLVPTVPLVLLAAFFFARSNPAWEQRLLEDPRFGPQIRAWRARGAIPRRAKIYSTALIGISALTSLVLFEGPLRFVGPTFGAAVVAWVWTRPG